MFTRWSVVAAGQRSNGHWPAGGPQQGVVVVVVHLPPACSLIAMGGALQPGSQSQALIPWGQVGPPERLHVVSARPGNHRSILLSTSRLVQPALTDPTRLDDQKRPARHEVLFPHCSIVTTPMTATTPLTTTAHARQPTASRGLAPRLLPFSGCTCR